MQLDFTVVWNDSYYKAFVTELEENITGFALLPSTGHLSQKLNRTPVASLADRGWELIRLFLTLNYWKGDVFIIQLAML